MPPTPQAARQSTTFSIPTAPFPTPTATTEVRLTGVSRGKRTAKVFHAALKELTELVRETISASLEEGDVQMFVVIMMDGEVETAPGSGVYSSVLESEPTWVQAGE